MSCRVRLETVAPMAGGVTGSAAQVTASVRERAVNKAVLLDWGVRRELPMLTGARFRGKRRGQPAGQVPAGWHGTGVSRDERDRSYRGLRSDRDRGSRSPNSTGGSKARR